MTQDSLGVAVIGAGMVGRAHAAGYRSATQLYDLDLPEVRLVAVADAYEPFAIDAAKRFGYERAVTSWQDIVDADDVDVVSVAIANELHRPVVEALLAAGKHVLCEKPLAPSVEDAAAMVAAAEAADTQSGVGFSFRRTPGINAIREQVEAGAIGELRHFNGHYWCDYALNPDAPISWRYKGGPGSGALADIGSHMIDLGEYVCGPITSVSGGTFQTFTTSRPVPVGAVVGHAAGGAVSDERDTVDNEDIATFTATFANGAVGTFSISRVAHGLPNGLGFEVFGADGAGGASTSTTRACSPSPTTVRGRRDQRLPVRAPRAPAPGPHPWPRDGLPLGRLRPERPVRLAGARLPRPGGRGRQAPARAVTGPRPAQHGDPRGGHAVRVERRRRRHDRLTSRHPLTPVAPPRKDPAMKLGAYTACLHDRTLPDALDVLSGIGLTSAEVNTGGFIPSPHCPVDGLLASAGPREEYLGDLRREGHRADRR